MVLRADQLLATICCQFKRCANNSRLKLHTKTIGQCTHLTIYFDQQTSSLSIFTRTTTIQQDTTTSIVGNQLPALGHHRCDQLQPNNKNSITLYRQILVRRGQQQQASKLKANLQKSTRTRTLKNYDQEQFRQQRYHRSSHQI